MPILEGPTHINQICKRRQYKSQSKLALLSLLKYAVSKRTNYSKLLVECTSLKGKYLVELLSKSEEDVG